MKKTLALVFLFAAWSFFSLAQDKPKTRYQLIYSKMLKLQERYPHLVEIISLGKNDQGIDIFGLRIEKPETRNQKISQLLVGTHHGNETDCAPLSLAFAEKILEIFDHKFSTPRESLHDHIYYIFPVLNISGYNQYARRERDAESRYHDPNRDYPDPCRDHEYFKLKSTRLIAEFIGQNDIVAAVTVHGYIGTFTYPWGFFTENPKTQDQDTFHSLLSYAVEVNNYKVGNHKDIIYPAFGSFEDWVYYEHGVWVALFEMKRGLDYHVDTESLIRFFERAPRQRSLDHQHYGQCMEMSATREFLNRSRP